MAVRSITQRWIFNTLSVIVLVIVIIVASSIYGLRNFYYTGVRQSIDSRANVVTGILIRISDDNTIAFNAEFRNLIENSDEKSRMEITAIDRSGRIALSSSGFSYTQQENMSDYEDALKSPNGRGYYVGKNVMGEKIMAVSVTVESSAAEYSAVRYVVSLENVDRVLLFYTLGLSAAGLVIIGLVVLSGSFFIRSIVNPVREVGAAARKFATGDMSARIVKKSDDELGELCDIINYMADEISASEEVKNDFISSVSHELRTPLTAIKGWSETLLSLEGSGEERSNLTKGLRVIDSETERLTGMVEELLDFSRMQNGRLTLVKTNMDILAELGEAVLIYGERARRDGIELAYEEPEMVSPIFGDKSRLRQVFINVIDNALKYSSQGGRVEISVSEGEGFVQIAVADTGCGIAPEDLPKIKTKFYKANQTRRGSGIGLAVADEIIRLHEGELQIESQLGAGTRVTILLPVNRRGETRKTEISTTMEFSMSEEKKEL